MALHAVVQPDRGGLDGAVVARQLFHFGRLQPAKLSHSLGRIVLHALFQRGVAQRISVDVVAIDQPLADQHVHHAQRERAVGAGKERDMLRALLRRQALVRIDGDDFGPAPLSRLHTSPQVQVRHDRVRAPEDDQLRFVEALRIHSHRTAEGGFQAVLARAGA